MAIRAAESNRAPEPSGGARLVLTLPFVDDSLHATLLRVRGLSLLRGALDQTPMLVWRLDDEDRVTWANAAYLRRAEARSDEALGWPLPRLLDAPRPVPGAGTATRRAGLEDQGAVSWYDCHSHRMGDEVMMFALPADAAVRAERSLRDFVQTLTKTFADLPIGLAIFDQGRNLQLFNPALIDLTNLPTGFLTARPSLFDFLDQLREQRMVPEPKDYRSWRQHMANLESAAATGHPVEVWGWDEAYLGVNARGAEVDPFDDEAIVDLAERIRSEILDRCGLTSCVGISDNKQRAKMATGFAKRPPGAGAPPTRRTRAG